MLTDFPRIKKSIEAIKEYIEKSDVKVYDVKEFKTKKFTYLADTSLGKIKVITEPHKRYSDKLIILSAKLV